MNFVDLYMSPYAVHRVKENSPILGAVRKKDGTMDMRYKKSRVAKKHEDLFNVYVAWAYSLGEDVAMMSI